MSGTVEESYPKEVFPNAKVRGIANNDVAAWIGEVASGQWMLPFSIPYVAPHQLQEPRSQEQDPHFE